MIGVECQKAFECSDGLGEATEREQGAPATVVRLDPDLGRVGQRGSGAAGRQREKVRQTHTSEGKPLKIMRRKEKKKYKKSNSKVYSNYYIWSLS